MLEPKENPYFHSSMQTILRSISLMDKVPKSLSLLRSLTKKKMVILHPISEATKLTKISTGKT
jgi:hypothetical protein